MIAVVAQIAAYVPFYFDGNYPGGGARFYADVLPCEHVLAALAAQALASRARFFALTRGSGAHIVGLSLLGFAVRAGHDHAQLRDRDGGAPLFSSHVRTVPETGPSLLFVETDAAYNLAFDPALSEEGRGVVRWKNDAMDVLAWRSRGSPPAFIARFVAGEAGPGRTVVEPYPPAIEGLVEGASLWPPVEQRGSAYALPVYTGGACSVHRALRALRGRGEEGAVRVALPSSFAVGRTLVLTLLTAPSPRGEAVQGRVVVLAGRVEIARLAVNTEPAEGLSCGRALRVRTHAEAEPISIELVPAWLSHGDPEGQPLFALAKVETPP